MKSWSKWNEEDNKKITGKLDSKLVSITEDYELSYFIQKYLEAKGLKQTPATKLTLTRLIKKYPGQIPIKRDDLVNYLDEQYLSIKHKNL